MPTLWAAFKLFLSDIDPRWSTKKNFTIAQLLCIDPLSVGAYSRFTSQPNTSPARPRSAAQRFAHAWP
ncbi:MAG: hypothetical protein DMG80_19630 [Acidobacteria bacterium]|nr:MAG: hypothetical protein DMG80_19630 [Acidobacteriota bacterium]